MKILNDYLPIICFFIVFKLYGIYAATAAVIVISTLQVSFFWFKNRRLETIPLVTLVLVVILGGTTLLLHDEIFIKWKPSVVYWLFTLALLGSQWFTKKSIMERMMGEKISLPKPIWSQVNVAWSIFFLGLGFLNIYVVYHFSTNAWVNFKLFGTLGLILVFAIAQSIYISRHMKPTAANDPSIESPPSE